MQPGWEPQGSQLRKESIAALWETTLDWFEDLRQEAIKVGGGTSKRTLQDTGHAEDTPQEQHPMLKAMCGPAREALATKLEEVDWDVPGLLLALSAYDLKQEGHKAVKDVLSEFSELHVPALLAAANSFIIKKKSQSPQASSLSSSTFSDVEFDMVLAEKINQTGSSGLHHVDKRWVQLAGGVDYKDWTWNPAVLSLTPPKEYEVNINNTRAMMKQLLMAGQSVPDKVTKFSAEETTNSPAVKVLWLVQQKMEKYINSMIAGGHRLVDEEGTEIIIPLSEESQEIINKNAKTIRCIKEAVATTAGITKRVVKKKPTKEFIKERPKGQQETHSFTGKCFVCSKERHKAANCPDPSEHPV